MSVVSNPYANKQFITTSLNTMLGISYTMSPQATPFNVVFSATQLGTSGKTNVVTITGLTAPAVAYLQNGASVIPETQHALPLGTLLLNGSSKVGAIVGYVSGQTYTSVGNGDYILDQTSATGTNLTGVVTIAGFTSTLQNALQAVLNNPITSSTFTDLPGNIQYYNFMTVLVSALNSQNASNATTPTTAGASAIRALVAMDDGTPIVDSGKCSYNTTTSVNKNQIFSLLSSANGVANGAGNTYVNFGKKIAITNGFFYADNTTGPIDGSGNYLTAGTAGGNSINENHQSRPEILLALLSGTGVGYAQRWSSTTRASNLYIAQRVGVSSEINLGTIRLNVPITFTGTVP